MFFSKNKLGLKLEYISLNHTEAKATGADYGIGGYYDDQEGRIYYRGLVGGNYYSKSNQTPFRAYNEGKSLFDKLMRYIELQKQSCKIIDPNSMDSGGIEMQ